MEKIKEKIIEINKEGGIESQSTYHTNHISLNKVIIRGDLEVNILALIWKDNETSIFLEIEDDNTSIQFNFEYNDIDNYKFNKELLKLIVQTVNAYKLKTI